MKNKILTVIMTVVIILPLIFTGCSDNKEINLDDFLKIKYDYDLKDYIDLPEYKGLKAYSYEYDTDEEAYIEANILSVRTYHSRDVKDDIEAKEGNSVFVNSVSTINGVQYSGGTANNYRVVIGSNTAGVAFENRLIGSKEGDHLSFDVSVPDNENEVSELRGKTVHYEVDIVAVCEVELPEFTDDFVKAYLGLDSIEAYKESLRKQLKDNYRDNTYKVIISQIWNPLLENTNYKKLPQDEVKKIYEKNLDSIKNYVSKSKLTLEQFAKSYYGISEEELLATIQSEAESTVKQELVCYQIARNENLTITEEEYTERATDYALNVYSLESLEEFEKQFSKAEILNAILIDMAQEKVADLADVTYVSSSELTSMIEAAKQNEEK